MNLSDYTTPPRKLKVGGGQDEGDAAAARASCLLHVREIFFGFSLPVAPANWGDYVPLGYW